MPGALSSPRSTSMRRGRFARYAMYAVGEVVLIFIGITLAVSFENASKEREQEALVRGLLSSVLQNLEANVAELERNITVDDTFAKSAQAVVHHLDSGATWNDSLGAALNLSLYWSSPFLATSGYESLKQSGLHQVADDSLRADMIQLFERTYAFLVGDVDRSRWAFQEAALIPTVMQELVHVGDPDDPFAPMAPRDFRAAVRRGQLRTMLLEHWTHLDGGTVYRQQALEETRALASRIEALLSEAGDDSEETS